MSDDELPPKLPDGTYNFSGMGPVSGADAVAKLEQVAKTTGQPPGHAILIAGDAGTVGIFIPTRISAMAAMRLARLLLSTALQTSSETAGMRLIEAYGDSTLAEIERGHQPADRNKLN
jgi:hypothetical protein